MAYALLVILISIILVVLALLLIPFDVCLWFEKEGASAQGRVRIGWLGITIIRREMYREGKGREGERKFELGRIGEKASLLRESLPHLTSLLKSFARSVSVRRFSCDISFGLADPVDTAVASGYLWSLASAVLNVSPQYHLSVRPDFSSERLDGSIAAELKVRLLRIIGAFVNALTKKPVRQLLRAMRS